MCKHRLADRLVEQVGMHADVSERVPVECSFRPHLYDDCLKPTSDELVVSGLAALILKQSDVEQWGWRTWMALR